MKQIILFFLCLVCLPAAIAAQDTCNLEVKDAPAVFGLSLGMSGTEARNVFGKDLKIKVKKKGGRVFFQNFIKKPAPQSLSGVRALYLRFLDDRLYQIEVFYEDDSQTQTLADFVQFLTAELKITRQFETIKGRPTINCEGFSLVADKVLNPKIELTDKAGLAAFEKLQAEAAK